MSDDDMYPTIIEAAARAVQRKSDYVLSNETAQRLASAVLAAVTPLIEDAYARRLDAAEEIARKGNEYAKGWKLLEDDGSITTLGEDHASIRAAALEEAALRIEADEEDYLMRNEIAAAIRALKASAEDST